MNNEEVIKKLQIHVDTLIYQTSDKGWNELVDKNLVRPDDIGRNSFVKHVIKQIAAYQVVIESLKQEQAGNEIPIIAFQNDYSNPNNYINELESEQYNSLEYIQGEHDGIVEAIGLVQRLHCRGESTENIIDDLFKQLYEKFDKYKDPVLLKSEKNVFRR